MPPRLYRRQFDFEDVMQQVRSWLVMLSLLLSAAAAVAQGAGQVAAAPVVAVANVPVAAATPASVPLPTILPTPGIGQPSGGWDLQQAMTPIAVEARHMANNILDPLMISVCVFVFGLLGYVLFRYRRAANPVASRTSHNTVIEVVWTGVPVLILVWIAVPSFRLLANQYTPPKADLTIKATGHQWYWEYNYPDYGDFSFDAVMLTDAEAKKHGDPDKLGVDNRVVVPVGATVRVLTTAADVIHAWAIPSFWVQMDAVPGRINETWFKVDRPGVYYGQCFQLCGTKHAFMPIAVEVVSKARFAQWIAAKQKENGIAAKPVTAIATVAAVDSGSNPIQSPQAVAPPAAPVAPAGTTPAGVTPAEPTPAVAPAAITK